MGGRRGGTSQGTPPLAQDPWGRAQQRQRSAATACRSVCPGVTGCEGKLSWVWDLKEGPNLQGLPQRDSGSNPVFLTCEDFVLRDQESSCC